MAPKAIAVADVDRDGGIDVASANDQGGNVSVFLNAGEGRFAPAQTYDTGTFPASVSVGDLDGDGYSDAAVATFGTDAMGVLLSRCR